MPLHPEMAAALAQVKALECGAGPRADLPVARQRALMAQERRYWNEQQLPMAHEERLDLPGPVRPVPVHVLRPRGAALEGPWIVYLHGGGWMLGSTSTHETILRGLAAASGCTVFGVDYALAPEHVFPTPVEETRWVMEHLHGAAARLGVDPARMAVAGDSSGANVALAAALLVQAARPGLVRAGVFYYGVFDDDLDSGSAAAYGNGEFGLSADRMRYYWDHYAPEPAMRENGAANLMKADLSTAFPMYLMAAECDILRDGAVRFAQRLEARGVPHRLSVRKGMGHAFMGYGRKVSDVAAVHAEAAAFLAAQFERTPEKAP